jgi:ribosome-associated protein
VSKALQSADLIPELSFTASRSGGPGGQHVNKVSSKITLRWDVFHSQILDEDQKNLLLKKLTNRLTTDGVLLISAQESRSQIQNKEVVLRKLDKLLTTALAKKKIRKATKPSKGAIQKRIEQKKQRSEKKQWRRRL